MAKSVIMLIMILDRMEKNKEKLLSDCQKFDDLQSDRVDSSSPLHKPREGRFELPGDYDRGKSSG